MTEDFTASVGQALVVLACLLAGVFRRRRLPARARFGLVGLAAAWILFHLVFRDNVWIPRLHLTFFAVSPVALVAFAGCSGSGRGRGRFVLPVLVALALVAGAGVAAVRTSRRPLMTRPLRTAGDVANYYRGGPTGVAAQQQAVLDRLATSGCRRLGLYLGGDSYDYPITWRAMKQGVQVEHVTGPSDWPCAVYSDRGPPPGGSPMVEDAGHPFLWVPAGAGSGEPAPR